MSESICFKTEDPFHIESGLTENKNEVETEAKTGIEEKREEVEESRQNTHTKKQPGKETRQSCSVTTPKNNGKSKRNKGLVTFTTYGGKGDGYSAQKRRPTAFVKGSQNADQKTNSHTATTSRFKYQSSTNIGLKMKKASVRKVAESLGIELGSLIDSSEIFDFRDGALLTPHRVERFVLKIYFKDRLSQGRFMEIKQLNYEMFNSKRKFSRTPKILDIKETDDFFIVYNSFFEHSLLQEFLTHKKDCMGSAIKMEKKLARWVVEILKILSTYWYQSYFFEFVSPQHTFFVDSKQNLLVCDFYGCTYLSEKEQSFVKQRNENYKTILVPPEFSKGKLNLENAGFDDIDAFIPSMIWIAAAQIFFLVTGSVPKYEQTGERFTLEIPAAIESSFTRHFKTFLVECLDHEMENRLADFDQVRQHKWINMNFAVKIIPTVQAVRNNYKKCLKELHETSIKSTMGTTKGSISEISMPNTRILYCRKTPHVIDKSEYKDKRKHFEILDKKLGKTRKFEHQILEGVYKELILNANETFLTNRRKLQKQDMVIDTSSKLHSSYLLADMSCCNTNVPFTESMFTLETNINQSFDRGRDSFQPLHEVTMTSSSIDRLSDSPKHDMMTEEGDKDKTMTGLSNELRNSPPIDTQNDQSVNATYSEPIDCERELSANNDATKKHPAKNKKSLPNDRVIKASKGDRSTPKIKL